MSEKLKNYCIELIFAVEIKAFKNTNTTCVSHSRGSVVRNLNKDYIIFLIIQSQLQNRCGWGREEARTRAPATLKRHLKVRPTAQNSSFLNIHASNFIVQETNLE